MRLAFCPFVSLSVRSSVRQSDRPSVGTSVSPSVRFTVRPSVRPFVRSSSVRAYVRLSVPLFVRLSIRPSARPSVRPYLRPSVRPCVRPLSVRRASLRTLFALEHIMAPAQTRLSFKHSGRRRRVRYRPSVESTAVSAATSVDGRDCRMLTHHPPVRPTDPPDRTTDGPTDRVAIPLGLSVSDCLRYNPDAAPSRTAASDRATAP